MVARHWLYFGGFVGSAILLVGAALMGILEGLSALSSGVPASEAFVLLAMLGAAAEWVVITLVLTLIATLFLVATVGSVLRGASLPRDDRLVSLVGRLERHYPILRQFDVSDRFEPTTDDRKQALREQYVAGEISDGEFERRLAQLMDETTDDPSRSEHEVNVDIDDRSR